MSPRIPEVKRGMTFPASVKVGGWEYQIEEWTARDAGRENKYARVDHAEHKMQIDTAWGEKQTAASLLHEILHCIWVGWAIKENDAEERTIEAIEYGLTAVWCDNPGVMAWIAKRLCQ